MLKRSRRPNSSFIRTAIAALVLVAVWDHGRRHHSGSLQPARASAGADLSDDRGRQATVPEDIPRKGLRDVFRRVLSEIGNDRVTLIAAGVTFYLLLALFPALAALVSLYGFVADPADISRHLGSIAQVLPPRSFDLIATQLTMLSQTRQASLSIAFVAGLAVALWSTHSGTLALFDAMNVAYGEKEKRSLVHLNLVALCFTICALLAGIALLALIAALPVILSFAGLDPWKERLALIIRWPFLLAIVAAAVSALYRFAPSRAPARLRWLTWGAAMSTAGWFLMSLGFSFYLDHFANYDATYGTLGALIGLLVWLWLSIVILIVGAELNGELEHQTAVDTTTGRPQPMGQRGAYVADTLGETVE